MQDCCSVVCFKCCIGNDIYLLVANAATISRLSAHGDTMGNLYGPVSDTNNTVALDYDRS